ncbi:MAG: hypothetical protein IKO10_04165 [Lachnospiraceae bacterium]|nr:hypothetical protein [Lachnospiraceae bacterium]
MSNIRDRGVLDLTMVEEDRFILVIFDDIEWEYRTRVQHAQMLQDKLNDYLGYIASGQAEEAKPGLRPVIRVMAQYSYSKYCIDFLERIRDFIKQHDDICELEWTHSEEDGPFADGFMDEPEMDPGKIYPRLKKNWAEKPLETVSLLSGAPGNHSDYPDNLIMIRFMESYIGMFVLDAGEGYVAVTYDMLPEGMTVEELESRAFDNLIRDIRYQSAESKVKGINGILAGGNFEAESLLFPDIWASIAGDLDDDVAICVPTKDIVYFTKASDKKLRKKMTEMAEEMFRTNQKETPFLLFSKDVLLYQRETKQIRVVDTFL